MSDIIARGMANAIGRIPNTQTWIATEGQTVFTLGNGSYTPNRNLITVIVGSVHQTSGENYIETNSTSFTLTSPLTVGTKVFAKWYEVKVPETIGHGTRHEHGGSDEIDITKLKNYDVITTQLAENAKHITTSIKYLSKEQTGNETLSDTLVRLAAAGGNHIFVDVPVTLMNTIVLEDNTVIQGLNTITEIRAGANLDKMVTFTQACTHFEIKNILFHGNFNSFTVNYGLYFTSATNKACPACFIQNVLVRAVTGIGYYSSPQILGLVMDNVHYEFCQGGGIVSQGHDVIISNIYVSDSAKVSGQGVILTGNNAKYSNIKVFVSGNTSETYSNTLSGIGSHFLGIEFQENQKGVRLNNISGCIMNLISDKNNVSQLSETADIYFDGVHYSNIATVHINRAVQGIPNKYGIKDIYSTHNQISANTDNSVVYLFKSSSRLPTTDFNNPIYIFGNEQFTSYTDGTTGGTVKYVGNGRFVINGTFASQSVNVFATYSNTTDIKTFNNVVLSLITTGNDELTLTYVNPDNSTTVVSPTNIMDATSITFKNVILKVSTSKTYSNAIVDIRVVIRNHQQMSIV